MNILLQPQLHPTPTLFMNGMLLLSPKVTCWTCSQYCWFCLTFSDILTRCRSTSSTSPLNSLAALLLCQPLLTEAQTLTQCKC